MKLKNFSVAGILGVLLVFGFVTATCEHGPGPVNVDPKTIQITGIPDQGSGEDAQLFICPKDVLDAAISGQNPRSYIAYGAGTISDDGVLTVDLKVNVNSDGTDAPWTGYGTFYVLVVVQVEPAQIFYTKTGVPFDKMVTTVQYGDMEHRTMNG
jgi:hypothetical protein